MEKVIIQEKATLAVKGEHLNGNSKPVICLTNGATYASCMDAAKAFGVNQATMSLYCNPNKATKHPKGYEFCYIEDLPLFYDKLAVALARYGAEEMMRTEEENVAAELAKLTHNYMRDVARRDHALQRVATYETKIAKWEGRIKALGGEVPKCAEV